jgi:carbonic anhydrase/acetyltransferase-like protein (isoleucine patch superfamily)
MIREFLGIKPEIDISSYIYPTAEIIGKVKIGKNVSIWPGVVLRGDVEEIIIGDCSNLQDNVVVHTNYGKPTILGKNITVGHSAVLHGCKIGNNCLIGMAAVLLDGCVIGDNCVIGAGSLVTEDTQIPEGSLAIGVPAKVVRKLSDYEIHKLEESAQHYLEKIKEYKKTLRQVL